MGAAAAAGTLKPQATASNLASMTTAGSAIDVVDAMNSILTTSLNNALASSQQFTQKAVDQQNTSLAASTGALNTGLSNATSALVQYLNNATGAATTNINQGFATSQALQSPYANAGYAGMDAYQDSLGLSRPQMGGAALAAQLNAASKVLGQSPSGGLNSPQSQELQSAAQQLAAASGKSITDPFATPQDVKSFYPTTPTTVASPVTPTFTTAQQQQLLQNSLFMGKQIPSGGVEIGHTKTTNKPVYFTLGMPASQGAVSAYNLPGHPVIAKDVASAMQNPTYLQQANDYLVKQAEALPDYQNQVSAYNAYQAAMNQYNTQVGAINTAYTPYQNAYNSLNQTLQNVSPQALQTAQAYNQGLFSPAQVAGK